MPYNIEMLFIIHYTITTWCPHIVLVEFASLFFLLRILLRVFVAVAVVIGAVDMVIEFHNTNASSKIGAKSNSK